jgi:hypothetical protein
VAELIKTDTRTVVDYMARDYDSLLASMRALIPDKLPEWSGHTAEADFGNVLLQMFAHMGDLLSYYQDRVANESFLGSAQTRRSIIEHLRLIGYRLATAAPAAAALQLSFPATAGGVVTVRRGSAFATKSRKDQSSVRFEYLGPDLAIDCALLPVDIQSGRKIHPEALPVEEGRTISGEILGTSDGRPNQRFRLAHAGVILRAQGAAAGVNRDLSLRTDLGGLIQEWALQESLAFSRAGQMDYAVEIDSEDQAEIIFGDGAFGAIPPGGGSIVVDYRVGGGALGNVPARAITTVVDAPALALAGAQVTNPGPATGGAEHEDIAHAVAQAPSVFRSLKRAVTADDYEALARLFKGVGKVRAVAGSWNVVWLFVAPEGGGKVSDVLRANLIEYFEDKRPVSTVIEIEDVDYVKIYVAAEVGIGSYYSRAEMREKVLASAGGLLAFANVDFKQDIYLSKFYEAIEAIEGVTYVNITRLRRTSPPVEPPGQIVVGENELPESGKIALGENEIPKVPDGALDQEYAGGIKLLISGGY